MKIIGSIIAMTATAIMLTSCCCDRGLSSSCCDQSPQPCAPTEYCSRPCAAPCPAPCPAPCQQYQSY